MRPQRTLYPLLLTLIGLAAHATPSGHKWFFPDCSTVACPATMQCVNRHCAPVVHLAASVDNSGAMTITGGVPYATFLTRAPEAFRAWTGSHIADCSTSYDVVMGSTFSSPQSTAAVSNSDATNTVIWLSGSAWRYSASTLGLTTTNYYQATNEIFDADMEFNNNVLWSTSGAANSYDLESVVLHEAGHFLGLDHTTNSGIAVMYPTVPTATIKRILAAPDLTDVCTVYPSAPGALGTPCKTKSDCNGLLVCEGAPGASQLTCVQECAATGDECPTAYTCRPSTSGMACLPRIGTTDQCKFCAGGGDCSTGICLFDSDNHTTYCSLTCADSSQCGPNYTCTATESGKYCVPNSICINQCTTASQCAADYVCTNGTCLPKGGLGNHCEIVGYCQNCGTCVGDGTGQGFCQTCCGASTGSNATQCKGCSNTSSACDGGTVCTTLGSQDSACLPGSAQPGNCQPCNNGVCATGLSCVNGRCHSSCNPQSPGTCAVCLANSSGSGACACQDEVANVNEPCGTVAGALKGCQSGQFCVGSPQSICRSLCDIETPTSCPNGFACQLIQNVPVCVPGSAGNKCSPCTNGSTCNSGLTCYLGRCYEACNVNLSNTCSTCVQSQANGTGVCGCSDQIAGPNEACGNEPEVHACGSGLKCLNGNCREQCNPTAPTNCPVNTGCTPLGNQYFCQDQTSAGGGGGSAGGGTGSTGGGGRKTGGGGGTTKIDSGCGCSTSEWSPLLLIGLLVWWRRLWR